MPPIYDIPEVRHLFFCFLLSLCFSSDLVFDRRVFCNRDDDGCLYDHHIDDDDVDYLDDNLCCDDDLDTGRLYLCVCLKRVGDPFFSIFDFWWFRVISSLISWCEDVRMCDWIG